MSHRCINYLVKTVLPMYFSNGNKRSYLPVKFMTAKRLTFYFNLNLRQRHAVSMHFVSMFVPLARKSNIKSEVSV